METYSRIWVHRGYGILQSYLSTTRVLEQSLSGDVIPPLSNDGQSVANLHKFSNLRAGRLYLATFEQELHSKRVKKMGSTLEKSEEDGI